MRIILCRKPIAISRGIRNRNIHYRIVILSGFIGKIRLEGCIFRIGYRGITDVGIGGRCTAQYHPRIVGVVIIPRVDKTQELLFETDVAVLYHLIHNLLHFFHHIQGEGFSFQFAELRFFTGYHFIITNTHLIQQSLLVFLCRVLLILTEKCRSRSIQFRSFFFYKRRIRVVKLQFTFNQVSGCDE